jgi:hypothetical protein
MMECVYSCNILILMKKLIGVIVGDQLYLERFVWFDHEVLKEQSLNVYELGTQFEMSVCV